MVRGAAGYWAAGVTTDEDFIEAMAFLIDSGIIAIDRVEPIEYEQKELAKKDLGELEERIKMYDLFIENREKFHVLAKERGLGPGTWEDVPYPAETAGFDIFKMIELAHGAQDNVFYLEAAKRNTAANIIQHEIWDLQDEATEVRNLLDEWDTLEFLSISGRQSIYGLPPWTDYVPDNSDDCTLEEVRDYKLETNRVLKAIWEYMQANIPHHLHGMQTMKSISFWVS